MTSLVQYLVGQLKVDITIRICNILSLGLPPPTVVNLVANMCLRCKSAFTPGTAPYMRQTALNFFAKETKYRLHDQLKLLLCRTSVLAFTVLVSLTASTENVKRMT